MEMLDIKLFFAGTTNSADSSLEACGVHLGGGLLFAGRKGGHGLHSCGGWRYIFSFYSSVVFLKILVAKERDSM